MQPTFWEQHQTGMLGAALAAAVALGLLLWWLTRPRPIAPEPPEAGARRALLALRGRAEEPRVVSHVARAFCRFIQAVLQLPAVEWTTDELLAALRQRTTLPPDLTQAVERMLRECEARSFAPTPPPAGAPLAERALELAAQIERAARPSGQAPGADASATGQLVTGREPVAAGEKPPPSA